jgi:hypothetical protein
MKKLLRNMSDEKSAAFWRFVDETAAAMQCETHLRG